MLHYCSMIELFLSTSTRIRKSYAYAAGGSGVTVMTGACSAAAGGGGGAAAASFGGAGTNLFIHQHSPQQRLYIQKAHLRCSIKSNLTHRPSHDSRPICALVGLLRFLRIVCNLLRICSIHNHNLALLTMRTCCTEQKHGVGGRDRHVERAYVCLPVYKQYVAAVHASLHGSARCVGSRLRDGVVSVAELELENVADGCDDGVGREGILRTTDDDGDDLVGAAEAGSGSGGCWAGECKSGGGE